MRTTTHNGRTAANGKAFNTKHNDRNGFEAEHIDKSKTPSNWTWTCDENAQSFDECERNYYTEHFGNALDARNARYEAQRHPERVRTIDQYRDNPRNCPEETITQIGKHGETVDPALLKSICIDQIKWEQTRFPNVKYLDLAMHVDETGAAPHLHGRKVWIAHDKDGNEVIAQNKALKEMGVERPDPAKPESRYNNAKQTYTRECREHFQQLCRDRGLTIETEPREPGKAGLSLMELKAQTMEAALNDLEAARGRLLEAGEIDLSGYKRTFFNKNKYIVPASDLRGLVRTVDEHKSVDEHAQAERERVQRFETDKLQNLARALSQSQEQVREVQEYAQELLTSCKSLQEFLNHAAERSPLVRDWKDLWERSQEALHGPDGKQTTDLDTFFRTQAELEHFERQNGLFPEEREHARDRYDDFSR